MNLHATRLYTLSAEDLIKMDGTSYWLLTASD